MANEKPFPYTPEEVGVIAKTLAGDTRIDSLRQDREEMESMRQAMCSLKARLERLVDIPSDPERVLELLSH